MNINGDVIIYSDLKYNHNKILKDMVALLNHQYTSTILIGINRKNSNVSMRTHCLSWLLIIDTWFEQDRILPNPVKHIKIRHINGILDIEITPGNDAPYCLTAKNNKAKRSIYIRESKETKLVSSSECL